MNVSDHHSDTTHAQRIMPNSRRRKKRVTDSRRQIERARRRLINQEEGNKENRGTLLEECGSSSSLELQAVVSAGEENMRGWWDGLYSWCHSGLAQVSI